MTLSPKPHVVYADFGVSRITKSGGQWKFNLALQSIPTIMCNGDAFSDDDFQMMDTNFGRLLAFRLRPGTYKVPALRPLSDGTKMFCRNYPDGGTNEDFVCDDSHPLAGFCMIDSDGSISKPAGGYGKPVEILDDLWGTYTLRGGTNGPSIIDPDYKDWCFEFSRSGSGSYEPHVGATRYVGSTPSNATDEAESVMEITYTKANVIKSMNRVV